MNLFVISYRRASNFFLFITCLSGLQRGIAQERTIYSTPWIQEIEIPSHYQDIPNSSFYLDDLGHLFIGKENGLTIFDGKKFRHIPMKGPVYVTGGPEDTLFYAARNDVGYLVRNSEGLFAPASRGYLIPSSQRMFIPSCLISHGSTLLMNSDAGVYTLQGNHIQRYPSMGKSNRLMKVGDQVFLMVKDLGILKWDGDSFHSWLSADRTDGDPLQILVKENGKELKQWLVLTSSGKFYLIEAGSENEPVLAGTFAYPEQIEFIDYIYEDRLLAVLKDKGLIIINQQGKIINILGSKEGLPDRQIRQIISRDGQEIWILSSHSLHKVYYPSSLNVLDLHSLQIGRILNSLVIDERVVIGTSHGLFQMAKELETKDLWKISGPEPAFREPVHLLTSSGKRVFSAGTGSLLMSGESQTIRIDTGSFTGLHAVDASTVIASNDKGLFLYHETEQGWNAFQIAADLPFSHSFTAFENQIFFLSQNAMYRLSSDLERAMTISFHMEDQLFRLMNLDGHLYLAGGNRVYRYEVSEETFIPLPTDRMAEVLERSMIVEEGNSGSYWMVEQEGKYRSRVIHAKALKQPDSDHILFPVLQHLGEIIRLEVIDSILFITGKQEISVFDLKHLEGYFTHSSVRMEDFQVIGDEVSCFLGGLEFQSVPEPLFRYLLHPVEEDWSAWNTSREVKLRDLKHGAYKIEVQAKDLYGRISEPTGLSFTVNPPVYFSWYAYVIYSILGLILLFLLRKWRLLSYQRAESRISKLMQRKLDDLTVQKERSDKLVEEVLPGKTATQLRAHGKAKWDKYERATVLFSDIQGFTRIAEEMNPEVLIDELDKFFFHFDSVVEKYNIEKIKTIGDAYMAAGGIPEKNSTNPVEVVLAALEMQSYMQQLKSSKAKIWDLRIGIHTGPVIAGVVGHKKVTYDLWGDTVNTASRMESSGMPGKVNISGVTYGMVKEYFICEYRGKLPVKYKGNIDMYFVNGLRPELSVDLKELPNKRFFIKLQLLRLGDLEERIFEEVLKELPETLQFHTVSHARKVYNQSYLLCRAEETEQEDRLMVRTAALLLFTGLTQTFSNFENRSAVIARDILPGFKYSDAQIDQICNLILATKVPFQPNNRLEMILIDAKMDYIGRSDYLDQIKLLYQEIKANGLKINGQQFKKQQLEILYDFEYFTVGGKRLREIPGAEQMASLEQERWI